MKKTTIALLVLTASVMRLPAAVPAEWEVDLAAQPPQVFTLQRPRGETYELKAVLKRHGKPFEPAITNACIYWQTNGMENLYWSAPASISNNVLRATWLPSMDPGATTVRGYIGDPGDIYAAAFQFRFIASPGATPNALPLPQPVFDFARVRVLNPPWPGGDTNAVIDIILATVDGAARPLPKYLHVYEANDSYTNEAAAYYRSRGDGKTDGGCSAVRSGGYLYRNFDFPFDDRAEFVVRMSASTKRFASVGVAQVDTNLTESLVTSGKPSRWYKALPGATVDGINEHGVVAEINVVDGTPPRRLGGNIHPLAAVRWALDNGTSAEMVATSLAARIQFPAGWTQNYHWMIADETSTFIVENGEAHAVTNGVPVMTNFRLYPTRDTTGAGQERYDLLVGGEPITNAWFTRAYSPTANWRSEFKSIEEQDAATNGWARLSTMAARRSTGLFWQTVHTSVYDITNRVLRVAVQEVDDWYVFQDPSPGGTYEAKVRAIASEVVSPTATTAGEALDLASDAETHAQEALNEVETAKAMADDAQSTANQAVINAANAQSTADYAIEDAAAAQTAAEDAWAYADQAQITADNAETTANDAMDRADAAQSTADEAKAMISATDPTFSNAVKTVMQIEDRAQNLSYTITADDKRFYFTPIGAINPED